MTEHFLFGCCYYPEHWENVNLRDDLARMSSLGFNVIRMGEFSWSMYEKEEGQYDFSFLGDAVRIAGEFGIDIILGTPTAAPPKWLIDKHPEVLCINAERTVMEHGSRQQHNHTSEVYLRYCAAITEAMVKYFADFPNVIGWQIDNELNCHRNESYSEADDTAFRLWLEKKYTTIDNLNRAWGNRFWSLEFNSFSQITCPRPTPTWRNPSWVTDFYLFTSDGAVNYAALQADILRAYMPHAFITHNGYFEKLDYKKLTRQCLDFLSYDSYPAAFARGKQGGDRDVNYKLALTHSCSEKFIVPEQQSGPGGQLSYMHPTPRPGQLRLWTYQSIAHGAVGILYFRYRTALYGAEQLWYGIYDHDTEENLRSAEVRSLGEEISRIGGLFQNHRPLIEVAIYKDYHNDCADLAEDFAENDSWYIFTELNHRNIHADFVDGQDDFSKYKVLVVPHITVADEALAEKIRQFTDNGGIALISARSGSKDRNAHYRPTKAPGVFRDLAGCRVDWFTAMTHYQNQAVEMNGKQYAVNTYYEMLTPEAGETIAAYTEDFCKDQPAIVKNCNVYYIGCYCKDSPDLYTDLISQYVTCRPPIDPQVEEIVMGDYTMYLNYGDRAVDFTGHDVIKEQAFDAIPAYGVVLVKNHD